MPDTIVLLRPRDNSSDLIASVEALGYRIHAEPVLSIEFLDVSYPPIEASAPLIFTSANGVDAYAGRQPGRDNPVYTVGPQTADAARRAGFSKVKSADGTGRDLAEYLIRKTSLQAGADSPVYVRGENVSVDLAALLLSKGLKIQEIVVYRARPADTLSSGLLQKIDRGEVRAILIFSARGGRTFARLIRQQGRESGLKTIKALCIGEAVLESVSVLPFQEVVVAATPDRYGMIDLLKRYANNE